MKKYFPYIFSILVLLMAMGVFWASSQSQVQAAGTSEGMLIGGINDWKISTDHFTGTFVGGSDTYTTNLADADSVLVMYTGATSGTLIPIGQVVSAANGTIKVFGDSAKTYWAIVFDKWGE